jgi:cell wall assembly regulator SMI1
MKKVTIVLSEKKVEVRDFVEFQNKFNLILPDNVKRLLLKFNGGLIKNSEVLRILLSLKYGDFSIEDEIDTHQISEQNIPQGYLPIALDYSDNPITITLNKGEDYGKIVLFELDFEGDGYTIANSLEELLGVNSIDDL